MAVDLCRGIAKLVKALDFDSSMRRFESFFPCQIFFNGTARRSEEALKSPLFARSLTHQLHLLEHHAGP